MPQKRTRRRGATMSGTWRPCAAARSAAVGRPRPSLTGAKTTGAAPGLMRSCTRPSLKLGGRAMSAPSYVHGASTVPLLGETIGENLRRTVERHGDREALVVRHQGYRATYSELWEQSGIAARALMARDVKKGDRVGIWAPNRYEWVIVQYATARMGAILVNINPAYRTSELEYALNQSGISFLILAARFRQADYVAMLGEVKGRCPGLREALVLELGWDALKRDASKTPPGGLH